MTSDDLRRGLAPLARFLPVPDARQQALLAGHIELLLRWNTRINLTAVREFEPAVRKHVAESLYLAGHLPSGELSICDVGSGGGFPGIPVAIMRPESSVTLIESDVRKGVFLREASRELPNVRVATSRFEEIEGRFDWLISRAVNLSRVRRGPEADSAAVLGGESLGEQKGLLRRFSWTREAIPWENDSWLWLGDVSNET